ncbi:MAG: SAM-dependent methyltransferase [Lentisphaerae bacterium GWF2_52_8]|nr:MAG: SAM-dependent methyltransferase [Lentisphaerae bacterium GWF2_52_8]
MGKNVHQWNAADYSRNSSGQAKWALELADKLKLKGNESLLDIGCGDGKISAELARRLPSGRVLGLDSSHDMIDLACKTFPAGQNPNLSFVLGDASTLNFDSEFDILFSNAALHWIPDQQPVLYGVECALRKGGRLLFQMGGHGNAQKILEICNKLISSSLWAQYFAEFAFPYSFLKPGKYKEMLVAAKLVPLRVELIPKDMQQKGRDGLAGWVRTTWMPYTERIPDSLREDFVSAIVDSYLAENPLDSDGNAHLGMVRLEVEASKP